MPKTYSIQLPLILLLCCIAATASADEGGEMISPTQAFGDATPDFLSATNTHNDWRTWITTPVWTRHYNREMVNNGELSEDNPGVGIERSNGRWHWMLGGYRNSIRQTSLYAQLAWTPLQWEFCKDGNLSLGTTVGLISGYKTEKNNYPIIPAAGLLISLETPYHVGMNLVIVPTIKSVYLEGFVAAQIKINF